MRRRKFIAGLGGVVVLPLVAQAQQTAMPIVGYLGSELPERFGIRVGAFQQGLSAMGYDEGRSVIIEYRWAGVRWIACRSWRPILSVVGLT